MTVLVEEYVSNLIKKAVPARFCFHCIDHTIDVVQAVRLISSVEKISCKQLKILEVAAWFHDTGIINGYENHEERSIAIAKEYLTRHKFSKGFIKKVCQCIAATKLPQRPKDHLGRIICDADLFHLSEPNYWVKNELLRKEVANCKGMSISDEIWLVQNLSFLRTHEYFTDYGKSVLQPLKQNHIQENITQIQECLDEKN